MGWKTEKLGGVCEIIKRGIAPKYLEEGGICVINQKCIRDHNINYSLARRHNVALKSVIEERYIQIGDVLVNSTGTGTLGRVAQVRSMPDEPTTVDTHVTIVRPKVDLFHNDFFGYMLIKIEEEITAAGEGASGQTELARTKLENDFLVSYPNSIPEQKRIVALLDTVFADLEQVRAKTEQNLKNARELFNSYLQQIFSQKGEGWVETTLGEITGGISTGPFGSLLHKSDYIENGIPLVNPAHIVGQKVVPDTNKTISEETAARLSAYKMKVGDIVIGRRGEMGRCALITQAEDGYLCGTGSFIIKSSDRCDGGFLVRFLRSASCVVSLEKIAGGAVMPNLSNSSLSKFGIRVPSKNKQIEITKLIDQLSIEIEKVVDIYNEKLNSINELKKSILQKAFSGELTTTAK